MSTAPSHENSWTWPAIDIGTRLNHGLFRELTKRKITIGEDFENDEILTPAKFEFQNAAIDDTVTVAYEVEGNGNGGDIIINCPNPTGSGYFIHFLSPNLPPLEKEIIFLIDKSGSMRKARRMQQAKEAMHNILGQDLKNDPCQFNVWLLQ